MKLLEQGLASMDEALAIDPHHATAQSSRILILHALGRMDDFEAISGLERALEWSPGHVNTLNTLGHFYKDRQEPMKALKAFDAAISLDPHHAHSHCNRGTLLNALLRFAYST